MTKEELHRFVQVGTEVHNLLKGTGCVPIYYTRWTEVMEENVQLHRKIKLLEDQLNERNQCN